MLQVQAGGATAYASPGFSLELHPMKGFVTGYATYGLEEDKAEVFAYLMATADFPLLLSSMEEDGVLARKVSYMLGALGNQSKDLNFPYLLKIHGQLQPNALGGN